MEETNEVKLPKPSLIITPVYTAENSFMELIPYWHTVQYFTFKNPKKKYNGVLYDNVNDVYIYSIPDRVKLNFDVKIKLPSVMYAYNVLHYMKQKFEAGGYFYLNKVRLQAELPKMYTNIIRDRLELDKDSPDNRTKMEDYLLNNSYNGLHEKINLASGNSQYYYNYDTNILVNFPDIPTFDKNTNGLVVDNTVISFNFSFDFWSHSNYVLELKGNIPDPEIPEDVLEGATMKYDFYVPTTFIKEQEDGKHLLVHKPFIPDINEEIDILEFSPIVTSQVKRVIEEALKYKLDMQKLLKVKVLIDNQTLEEIAYDVDWKTLTLKTKNPMSNVTYTLIIYGNLKGLNLIEKCIMDNEKDKISSLEF